MTDPWISSSQQEEEVIESRADLETSNLLHNPVVVVVDPTCSSSPDKSLLFFDDDFQPQPSIVEYSSKSIHTPQSKPFTKLPDSDQYLASLGIT